MGAELKIIMFSLVVIDAFILSFMFILNKRISYIKDKEVSLQKEIEIFEKIVSDADKIENEINKEFKNKKRLIKKLNEELDRRIENINVLMNRSDIILKNAKNNKLQKKRKNSVSYKKEIIYLSRKGYDAETIARKLDLPKGEVMLVLNLVNA